MRSIMKLMFFSWIAIGLAACGTGTGNKDEGNGDGEKEDEFIQVTVERVGENGEFGEEKVIGEKDAIREIADIVGEVAFEEGMMGVTVMPDLRFSLYEPGPEEGEPVKLHSYEVWFNGDAAEASIKDEHGRYGKLDENQAKRLQNQLQVD